MTNDRTLSAMHPSLVASFEDALGGWQNLNGWSVTPSTNTLYHETQIDLSGYAAESLTYFPEAVGIQDPGTYLARGGPGSGDPTAADKLFCYRIVSVISDDLGDGALAVIPAARQILNGYMDEETELVYMQRLKRSYELANQV
jgi:hypothetical protein